MSLRLFAFTCGWLTLPLGSFLEGEKGKIKVPVPSYLIVHPRGRLLFDTGMHPATQADQQARLGPISRYFTVHFQPGEEIAARLAALDIDADRIELIVNSHLHYDHAGGNQAIRNATLIVQRREWEAAHDPDMMAANSFFAHDYDHGHKLRLIDGEHDVFGDGSVVCLPTHGHTPGHQSLRVRLPHGDVVLCGDCCYLRRSLDTLHLPAIAHDREEMIRSMLRIRALREAGARVFYGHDPEFWAAVPQAPAEIAW